mgnify:CR=1 FL=1|tara:strand:- start:267 stop:785 length:519 start_codon:yes stop_codon:yes gene_type:complete
MPLIKKIFILASILLFLNGCGGYKPVDTRKVPIKGTDRARKNVEEGRGFKLGNIGKRGSTNYEFSTSNPMWRASLDILDFLPLVTVDYSGGMIISDWYNDGLNKNDSIKITIRFLSNDVKTNSLNIIVHKKTCVTQNQCLVKKIKSQIEDELKISILKKAALLEKENKKEKK